MYQARHARHDESDDPQREPTAHDREIAREEAEALEADMHADELSIERERAERSGRADNS